MKKNCVLHWAGGAVLGLVMALVSGCATGPSVDWNSRVGHYTYAQAVHDLGPPNRRAQSANGDMVFKWFESNGGGPIDNPMLSQGYNNAFDTAPTLSPDFGNHYLQLTFDTNGVLAAWSKHQ